MNWQKSFLIIIIFLLNSCNGEPEMVIDEAFLTRFNAVAHPENAVNPVEQIDCYLDYSFGMGEGMRASSSMNDKLKNFLTGRKVTFYKVGASAVPPPININSPEANFLNSDNYVEPGSKLKVAVDKITNAKNKVSVFITDFERVESTYLKQNLAGAPAPHPIDASAWAQVNFKEWINTGNQIDIFAKLFRKPDYWFARNKTFDNWIYTIIFTPAGILKNSTLYKTSVLKFMEDQYKFANKFDSRHFSYSANNFKIEQGGNAEPLGNANDNIIVQTLIANTKEKGFEYYEFTSDDLVTFNTDATLTDKRLLNKVKISSQMPCFSNVQFGIQVYDITQSLKDFYNVIYQEAPEVTVDVETGKKDTIANKPIKYNYRKGGTVNDVFDFVYNTATKEVGIKLKPDFTGVPQTTIYQVDIVIKSVKQANSADADNVLKLNYSNGYAVKALGESIKYAMNDVSVNIENKAIYTFYLKIDN